MIYICPKCNNKFQCEDAGLFKCPSCSETVQVQKVHQKGTDWDRAVKGNFLTAFFETIKKAIVDPIALFSESSLGEGLLRPLIFAVIITGFVFVVAAAYQAGFQALAFSFNMSADIFPFAALSLPLSMFVMTFLAVIFVPVFTVFGLFVQAGIYHLCLMIIGQARRDFWATFRTVCYSTSPQIFQIVPVLGSLAAPVWQIALSIIGIKVVHRTTYGKSALAVFLPTIFCCGTVFLILVVIMGGVFGGVLQGLIH